jgi:neutral ceramidase
VTGNRAGWSQVDITPPLGLPMGGRGPRYTPGASIHSPLLAQACALQDAQGRRTLWISLDLIGLPHPIAEPLRYDIAAFAGVPYEAVILNYAHTHSGPMVNSDDYADDRPKLDELIAYETALRDKILRLACDAVANLRPAEVVLHRGTSDLGINRRRRLPSGEMALAPNPEGVYNPDLWAIDIRAADGERCLLFNYGCHAVIAYGFAWDGISSDYPGVARRRLAEQLGDGAHCQFIQGLAGDVRPRILADLESGRFSKSKPDDLETAGAGLAQDVLRALDTPGEALVLDLAAATGWVHAERDLDALPPLSHWQTLATSDDELSHNLGTYWAARIESGLPPAHATPWPIGVLRLSPAHRIAWIGGEAVAEWQAHLRTWLDDPQLIVWGYCQEVPAYLPTDELLPEGGYEVVQSNTYGVTGPAPFAPGLNERMHARFVDLVTALPRE